MLITATSIAMFMLALAAACAMIRLALGPSVPDRVVAADLLGTLSVGLLVVGAAASGQRAFLDTALIIALIAFVSTIAYARYIERKGL